VVQEREDRLMENDETAPIGEDGRVGDSPSSPTSQPRPPGRRGSIIVGLVGAALFVAGAAFMAYDYEQKMRPKRALAKAELLREQGRLEEALAQYERVVELDPDNSQAWVRLGIAAYEVGRPKKSAAAYRRAIALNGGVRVAHDNLAFLLYHSGRIGEAVAQWERAAALPITTPAERRSAAQCFAGLGIGYLAQGERQEAARMYGRAAINDDRYLNSEWLAKRSFWSPEAVGDAEQLIPAARQRRARWEQRQLEAEEEEEEDDEDEDE
jgi:tetratricopeptide (TPR) repeat protein